MTKTIILCDVCGREVSVDERIALKKRVGRRGGELNCDMCRTCFDRISSDLKSGRPGHEDVFIATVRAAVEKHTYDMGKADATKTADLDSAFYNTVYNALVAYDNALIETM